MRRERKIDQRLPKDLKVEVTTSMKQKLTKTDLRTKRSVKSKTPPARKRRKRSQ